MLSRALVLALLCAASLVLGDVRPAEATNADLIIQAGAIRELTPQCRDYPNAPVRGFVVGNAGLYPTRTFSFVGCFQSLAECERWRRPVSNFVQYRMIQNRCVVQR